VQAAAGLCFIALFLASSLDHRFAWSDVAPAISLLADGLAVVGFGGVFLTFRENSFTAATIRVEDAQPVISTGPYGVVRHPMYAAAGVLVLASPIALGSWWGLLPAALLMAAIVVRLIDEERFLSRNLTGYTAYRRQVRYRLVPGIW
jgi:protein-S-isoprenylcysteine O-methyltransferase Ste14